MPVIQLAKSPDARWIAAARSSKTANELGVAQLIDTAGDIEPITLRRHTQAATSVAFSPDGSWLASAGRDGIVAVWRFEQLEESVLQGKPTPQADFELDTTSYVDEDGLTTTVRLEYPRRLAFHPRGGLYATCGDGILFEWDLNTANPSAAKCQHHLHSNNYLLPDVAVSPDGRLLAVARHGWDGEPSEGYQGSLQRYNMVLVFDVSRSGNPMFLHALPANFNTDATLAFSPDNRWLAASGAGERGPSIWDVTSSNVEASLVTSPVSAQYSLGMALSPDGSFLSIGASDGNIYLWKWRTDEKPLSIATGSGLAGLVWMGDTQIAVGGVKGTVEIWETNPEMLQKIARRSAGRSLTEAEAARFGLTAP